MTPSSSRSDTLDPAARERNDLAEAFARVLLSEGPIAAQAPVFFQEPDGTMIWANDGYYALAALLVNASEAQRLLHPNLADAPANATSWTVAARGTVNGRAVTIRASYAKLTYGARQKPALAGFVQVVPDESDVARRLLATQERLEDVVRLVSDWVWEIDADSLFTIVSDRAQRATGFHPRELIGTSILALAADGEIADGLLARLQTMAPFRDFTLPIRAKDGGDKIFLVSAVPVFDPDGGSHLGYRGTASDITDLSERERSILAAKEAGRAGQPLQDQVPRQHEPRAAHAAQRHHRLLRHDGARHPRTDGRAGLRAICRRHQRQRQAPALHHQRHPRHREDRGRPAGPDRRGDAGRQPVRRRAAADAGARQRAAASTCGSSRARTCPTSWSISAPCARCC